MSENLEGFAQRKRDHIELSLAEVNQATGQSGFHKIELIHEALPEIDFDEVRIDQKLLGKVFPTPFLISSMTAGHDRAKNLNLKLASASAQKGWLMGVGSQRRELFDSEAANEWSEIKQKVPEAQLIGNIGLSQAIQSPVSQIEKLIENLGAVALFVHVNALQEVLQKEGTPNFRGGFEALTRLSQSLSVPVILKETGCGFSAKTLSKVSECGVKVVDVSGFGGTHWGRIEGQRSQAGSQLAVAAQTFSHWGISTLDSLMFARKIEKLEVWASGGIRSGLEAAKALAVGAQAVALAKPILEAVLASEDQLLEVMEQFEFELKVALFCTGSLSIQDLQREENWKWV